MIDADMAVRAIVPSEIDRAILHLIEGWREEQMRIVAPELLLSEAASTIRRLEAAGRLPAEDIPAVVEKLFLLQVETIGSDQELCRSALQWAGRLGQSRAYEAFYLALAERLGAELWTTDRRLASGARRAGAARVRLVGEAPADV